MQHDVTNWFLTGVKQPRGYECNEITAETFQFDEEIRMQEEEYYQMSHTQNEMEPTSINTHANKRNL